MRESGQSSDGMERFVNDVHQGDVVETLREMPADSVHMAMCSPPYYGLRDYGVDGQIGLEKSLDEYIDSLVEVADELERVLRGDGSWWLNLGDSFAGSGRGQWDNDEGRTKEAYSPDSGDFPEQDVSLRRKSKMLVPHRVAIALQDAGWIVRSDAVWSKPNPMPHPVKDRLNEHKEFVFHLTPEPDYWFDLDAVREPHKEESLERNDYAFNSAGVGSTQAPREDRVEDVVMDADDACHPRGKNPGDIIEVPVKAFPDAHFAVYPPELCEKPIKASAPENVCANCGTPYDRVTEQVPMWERDRSTIERDQTKRALEIADDAGLTDEHFEAARAVGLGNLDGGEGNPYERVDDETAELAREAADVLGSYYREALMSETEATGEWKQTCDCETDETESGIVLDPFAGAGTTCLVAKELGRRFVGIDLNAEYVAMAQKRVGVDVDQPEHLLEDDQTTLLQTDGGETAAEEPTDTDRSGGAADE
jgi:DNA modification methylase